MIIIKAREKNHLEVTGVRFYGEMFQKLIAMPDRKRFKDGRFIFLICNSNLTHLLDTFQDVQFDDDCKIFFNNYYNFLKDEKNKAKLKEKPLVLKDYPKVFKTKPFDHQLKAFEISKDSIFYGLLFEQGCGKTKVIIDNACYLFQNKKIDALVVIAPNGVHKNWATDELPVHCKEDYELFLWSGKKTKTILKKLDEINHSNKLKIFLFNVESFVSNDQQDRIMKILKYNRCLLAIDESQTIKNPSAKRTKFIVGKAAEMAKYRRILTGTPVTKGVQDIYTQLKFLSSDIVGISSFFAFKNKYCLMGGFQQKQIIGYKEVDKLQEKIQTHTMRVLKNECLDLPDKLYQKAPFDLTKEQLDVYNEIKEEGITFIRDAKANNEPITFDNVLSRMKKLQQVCSGYLMNIEEKSLLEIIPPEKNPRLIKLKELLNDIDGKVIIWTIYTQDIIYIKNMLGDEAVRYDGKINSEQKEFNKKSFRNDPNIKYLIANTQAMARGHTLTEAETSIYYNNSYDLELRLQSEDRNHRTGTKNNVLYIDLEANKTMDKKIIKALRSKKKVADMVLQDPDNLFME